MKPRPIGALLAATAGPLLWALYLGVVYAGEAVLCTVAQAPAAFPAFGLLTTAAVLAGLAALLAWQVVRYRRTRSFLDRIALLLTALSLAATLWTAFPILMIEPCASQ